MLLKGDTLRAAGVLLALCCVPAAAHALELRRVCDGARKAIQERNFHPVDEGSLEEIRTFIAVTPGIPEVQKALSQTPLVLKAGLAQVATYDGRRITLDRDKAKILVDYAAQVVTVCGASLEEAAKARKVSLLYADRIERDIKTAGALAHEAQHRLNRDSGGHRNESTDEESAYSSELNFYVLFLKADKDLGVCRDAGAKVCKTQAALAAKDLCETLWGFENNPKEKRYDRIYSRRIAALCDPIRRKPSL